MEDILKPIVIELQPDDVILVKIHGNMSSEQIDGMQKYLKECFGDRKIIIVGPTADFHIIKNSDVTNVIEDFNKKETK